MSTYRLLLTCVLGEGETGLTFLLRDNSSGFESQLSIANCISSYHDVCSDISHWTRYDSLLHLNTNLLDVSDPFSKTESASWKHKSFKVFNTETINLKFCTVVDESCLIWGYIINWLWESLNIEKMASINKLLLLSLNYHFSTKLEVPCQR